MVLLIPLTCSTANKFKSSQSQHLFLLRCYSYTFEKVIHIQFIFPYATMIFHALYVFLLLCIFPRTHTLAVEPPAYSANYRILLSCGESPIVKDSNNRSWAGDEGIHFLPSNATNVSSASTASYMDPSVFAVPYRTARVIHSPLTYTFPLGTGQIFLRLYFYPDVYSGFHTSQSLFSVTANSITLLSNFSAFFYSKNTSQPSFMNEFVIRVGESQSLGLTFSPNSNSFAFVNGIEIVSIPDTLFGGDDVPMKLVGQFTEFVYLNNNTALENVYRLNVGGSRIEIQDDSGMFRGWSPDDDYIYGGDFGYTPYRENLLINYTVQTPRYSAPALVYTTARVTANYSISLEWGFPVVSGFYYLLRLHFCEFTLDVTGKNERVFTISINNQKVETEADVISWTGSDRIPIFKDYIISLPDASGHRVKQDLRLSLVPNAEGNPKYHSALLNGLEIFKLNDPNNSLAAGNPGFTSFSPPAEEVKPPRSNKSRGSSVIYAGIGGATGILAVVAAVTFLIYRRQHKVMTINDVKSFWVPPSTASTSTTRTNGSGVARDSNLCRRFSLDEIKTATRSFDESSIIGKGGFGNVYKGLIDNATTTVAIKRLHPSSNQGAREFLTEIEMLSKLRHLHLVSLIGYCDDGEEMILVYHYMAHGTLCDHLYNPDNPPLTWKQRLQICIGAAKGLYYLHNGAEHTIIHRDVKSTNILLDEAWEAKISDFGLSKMGQANDSFTHISTNVKGTFGYLDPKYLSTRQLTRKSDVYAFGVVLFEVVSGRAAVDIRLDEEQHSLAGWARHCIREGEVDRLIDLNLMGQISAACFKVFVGIAGRCILTKPLERPTMADVVMGLELALALQQTTDSAEQVEEDDDAGRIYKDGRDGVISKDDIIAPKEESDSDEFIREDNPSSSTRKNQIDEKNGKI